MQKNFFFHFQKYMVFYMLKIILQEESYKKIIINNTTVFWLRGKILKHTEIQEEEKYTGNKITEELKWNVGRNK